MREGPHVAAARHGSVGTSATTAWVSTWDGFLTPIDTNTDVVERGSESALMDPRRSRSAPMAVRRTLRRLGPERVDKSITPVNLRTGVVGRPIRTGAVVGAVVVTPDGNTLYTLSDHSVTPVDLRTRKAATPITRRARPDSLVVAPNGRTVYVTNSGDGTVTQIDTTTNKAKALIRLGGHPYDIAVAPDGATLYVTNYTAVVPVDTATNRPAPRSTSRPPLWGSRWGSRHYPMDGPPT